MVRWERCRRACGYVVAAVLVVTLLHPPAPAAELDQALNARKEANRASVKSQDTIDKLSEQTESLVHDYRGVLDETDALRVYNAQLERLVNAQDSDAASLESQIQQVALVGRALSPLMLRMIDALAEFVSLDVPFLTEERNTRVANLRSMMDRADVTDSEKYRRILEAYQIENEYGRTIEAYQGNLEVEGKARAVDFLRVGRIALVYQTLDGEETGAWDSRAGAWVKLGNEYRLAIRQGLRIARKQAAPDLIRLPVQAAEVVQ